MSAELHNHWCVLCLHDGSEEELVDVLSMSDLSDRIAEEYEICVNRNDLAAKICMPCFQETLNFRKQRRLYEAEKERILKNQNHFRQQKSRSDKQSYSSAPTTFDDALKLYLVKSSKSVTQHPKDSASKTNDIPRIDMNSGEQKGRLTIKLKRKRVPSNKSTNPLESDKQPVSKNSKTATDKDKQGFISTNALFKNALEGKKRVRFSIQKDTDEESVPQPRKRTKYAESGEEANGSTSKKQSLQGEVENKKSQGRDPPGPANGQQQQKSSNPNKKSQQITSKTQRPSASGAEKTVVATAATCADAVRASAVVAGPTTASIPASTTAVRKPPDTEKSNETWQQKPSNSTKGDGTHISGSPSDLQNRSAGQVGENLPSLSKTTLIATNGAAPIPLSVFLMRDSLNKKGLKRIPKIVKTTPSVEKDTAHLGTFKITSSTALVTGSRPSASASTKQTSVSRPVAPDVSSNHGAPIVVTSTSASGDNDAIALTSNTGQVCATSASNSSNQNQLGSATPTSSGALGTTCIPPSCNTAADPVHPTSAGQLPITSVVNATIVGVTGASSNAGTADSYRQLPPVASTLSPAVITVSECESIYSNGSMTTSFGTPAPASTNTTTVTDMPVATAVTDGLQQRSAIAATPAVEIQPTVTSEVLQPASSRALALLQQETTASGATAASPGAESSTSGGIKKRRHSTFIRVNPNLFDEPADQFASIRKNLLIRTAESTVSSLQMSPFLIGARPECPSIPASTVANAAQMQFRVSSGGMLQVSQTNRTQTTTTVNINQHAIAGNSGTQHRTSTVDLAPVSQIPVHVLYKPQNNGGPNVSCRTVPSIPQVVPNGPGVILARGPSTVATGNTNIAGSFIRAPAGGQHQPPRFVHIIPTPNDQGQAASAVANTSSNNSVRSGTVGGMGAMSRCFQTTPIGTMASTSSNQAAQNAPPNSTSTQTADSLAQKHPVLMCQLCTEFFLSQASLAAHLNQVHYVEFSRSLYSTVYDESIWKLLVARARRKSIASPDDFRVSR